MKTRGFLTRRFTICDRSHSGTTPSKPEIPSPVSKRLTKSPPSGQETLERQGEERFSESFCACYSNELSLLRAGVLKLGVVLPPPSCR